MKIYILLLTCLLCVVVHKSHGQGVRYNGSFQKSTAIHLTGVSNMVIEGLEISSDNTHLIALYNCKNIVIRNNLFSFSHKKPAIYLDNCKNVTIIDNSFYDVQTGLLAHKSQTIKFEYNEIQNVLGALKGGREIGNMVQFDKVSGIGNSISYNVCENIEGKSSPEDVINLYFSHGLPGSPIVVRGNWIRGGGPSLSGGGILLGDMGGSYQVAEDNIVVNGGQYGISIGGGDNMILRKNLIYGTHSPHANIGLYAANWYVQQGISHDITVENNVVNFTNRDGQINNWWFADNMEPVKGKETNKFDVNLDASILPRKIIGRVQSDF